MSLWIRSQDKSYFIPIKDIISEFGGSLFYKGIILGDYKTKERALEVLDEINDLLEQEEIFHIRKSSLNNLDDLTDPKYILNPVGQPRVYTMPIE